VSGDLKELAVAWAASQEVEGDRSDVQWQPIFDVHGLVSDAERLWAFVLVAEPLCQSAAAFSMLGTGPLEDLIQEYGDAFVDRIEHKAKESQRFSRLFEHVWVPASADPVTQRYLALGCTAVGPAA
jgi:formylmethanofuran dehydrogenase subunit E-like metal-binding protein